MSANLLWGEAKLAGALQAIETVLGAPILNIANVAIDTVYPDLVLESLFDVNGDPITDIAVNPLIAIVAAAAAPAYWQTAEVTTDGGVPFEMVHEFGPWQVNDQGGESVFAWLHLTFSWSMAATLRVQATVDGSRSTVTLADGSTLELVDSTFTLDQQTGTMQRLKRVFTMPLVRRQMRSGVEVGRYYLRGERLSFTVYSVGMLGVGELMLEGAEVEYAPVRKAIYPAGVQT